MIDAKCILLVAALLAPAAPCAALRAEATDPQARLMGQARIEPQLGNRVPLEIQFRDSSGATVRLDRLFRERPVILHLVYYQCPMLCKLAGDGLLQGLAGLDFNIGDEFDVVTLSFDPNEGVELAAKAKHLALERYGRRGASEGWHFLSGEEEAIGRLTSVVGFHPVWDTATQQFAHPSGVFVLTPGGVVSCYLSGIDFRSRDLELALIEASLGKIGSFSDQLLMLCYEYDPTTGRYGLAIMTGLRAAGIATFAILVGGIWAMLRRERRRQAANDEAQMTHQ
jgi:protein SCO1/2